MASEVNQGGASAVRAAPEVYAFITKRSPDLVEIVHGNGSGVHTQVGIVPIQTIQQRANAVLSAEQPAQIVGFCVAGQAVRLPCSALVYEDNVALSAHIAERHGNRGAGLSGTLPWPAGQHEERIRLPIPAESRIHHNAQFNLASGCRSPVFVDRYPAATRIARSLTGLAVYERVWSGGSICLEAASGRQGECHTHQPKSPERERACKVVPARGRWLGCTKPVHGEQNLSVYGPAARTSEAGTDRRYGSQERQSVTALLEQARYVPSSKASTPLTPCSRRTSALPGCGGKSGSCPCCAGPLRGGT